MLFAVVVVRFGIKLKSVGLHSNRKPHSKLFSGTAKGTKAAQYQYQNYATFMYAAEFMWICGIGTEKSILFNANIVNTVYTLYALANQAICLMQTPFAHTAF